MDGELTELEEVTFRLLHHASFRAAWRQGAVRLRPSIAEALRALEPDTVEDVAQTVVRDVLQRSHSGCGDVRSVFPRSIAAWRTANGDAPMETLIERFLESPWFERYRELPYQGLGPCFEEAFFRFLDEEGGPGASEREQEFLAAMLTALAVSPRPSFRVPEEIRRTQGGFVAVSRRGTPTLHAAIGGGYLTGPVTPLVAELLSTSGGRREIAARHALPPAALSVVDAELERRGLL